MIFKIYTATVIALIVLARSAGAEVSFDTYYIISLASFCMAVGELKQ